MKKTLFFATIFSLVIVLCACTPNDNQLVNNSSTTITTNIVSSTQTNSPQKSIATSDNTEAASTTKQVQSSTTAIPQEKTTQVSFKVDVATSISYKSINEAKKSVKNYHTLKDIYDDSEYDINGQYYRHFTQENMAFLLNKKQVAFPTYTKKIICNDCGLYPGYYFYDLKFKDKNVCMAINTYDDNSKSSNWKKSISVNGYDIYKSDDSNYVLYVLGTLVRVYSFDENVLNESDIEYIINNTSFDIVKL